MGSDPPEQQAIKYTRLNLLTNQKRCTINIKMLWSEIPNFIPNLSPKLKATSARLFKLPFLPQAIICNMHWGKEPQGLFK